MPGGEHSRLGMASEAPRLRWAEGPKEPRASKPEDSEVREGRGDRPPGKDVAFADGDGKPLGDPEQRSDKKDHSRCRG